MNRLWIVCASCKNAWPLQAAASPYLELQFMTQPCSVCEAYTLSCVSLRDVPELEPASDRRVPAEDRLPRFDLISTSSGQ